jgi:hypothetical protein
MEESSLIKKMGRRNFPPGIINLAEGEENRRGGNKGGLKLSERI